MLHTEIGITYVSFFAAATPSRKAVKFVKAGYRAHTKVIHSKIIGTIQKFRMQIFHCSFAVSAIKC